MEEIKPKKERKFLKAMGDIALTLFRELVLGIGKKVINKVDNKRQGLVIVFLLVAGISYASIDSIPYPLTGNKQRLGWQTSGNGLVYRGRSNDTITKPSSYVDKNVKAYLLVDSVLGTIFVWRQTYWDSIKVNTRLMPFDSITFNTAKNGTVGVGEVEYNDTQGSLIQGLKGGNVTNVIGQQLHQRVNNRTGAPLAKGDVVYLAGSQGNRITVAKGLAVTDAFSANTFGVVAESIADNQSGFIITEGLITGLNTSALTEDSAVYLSPTVAGALTSTKPQAPQHSVYIGVCVKSNNGSGELFVKIRNGQELDELHDVQISSPVTGATLFYSGGLWRDTTAALLVSDTAFMLANYATKAYADTTGRLYARQDFTSVSSSTLTWTQSDTLIPGGVNVVQVYRNGQILLPTQYTIPTSTSVVIAASSFKVNDNYTVIFPRGGGAGSGGGSGSLTSISAGTGITVSPNPITTTGVVSADLSVLMELTDTSLLNLTSRFASKLNTTDTASLSNRIDAKGTGTVTSVATGYGLTGGTITSTGTLVLDSAVVFSRIRDSIVDVAIGNDTIKILKQEYAPATTSVLTWTVTPKFPIQLKQYILVFRNGQLLINDQYNLTDTNKITIVSNSFKVGANYTVVTVSGIGSVGTGVFQNPIYPEAGIALSTGTTWASSIPNNSSNWNTAFTDRLKWDGGSTGLVASTGRTSLGGTTIGQSMFTLTNPSAISFPRFNVDNTVTALSATTFRSAIGAGTVTSVNVATGTPMSIINNTTTPEISMVAATGSVNGYLASTDWTTFNNKQNALGFTPANSTITINTTSPLQGGGNLSANRTLSILSASDVQSGIVNTTSQLFSGSKVFKHRLTADSLFYLNNTSPIPTAILGINLTGGVNSVGKFTLGNGLSITSSTLLADTNLLVTRFDTASMLTPYFRDADTTSLNLTSRFAAKLNLSDTLNMLVPYLRKADTTNMLLPYFRDADTSLLNLTSRFAAKQNILTNPVTGTGTNNFLPKFTTTGSTIGNSTIQDNGTTVSTSSILSTTNYVALDAGNNTHRLTNTLSQNQTWIAPSGFITSFFNGNTSGGWYFNDTLSNSGYPILSILSKSNDRKKTGITLNSQDTAIGTYTPAITFSSLSNSGQYYSAYAAILGKKTGTGNSSFPDNLPDNNWNSGHLEFYGTTQATGSLGGIMRNPNMVLGNGVGIGYDAPPTVRGRLTVLEKLGINQSTPAFALDVNGTANITGATTLGSSLTVEGATVFGSSSAQYDFRVSSGTNVNMIFMDASENKVGIGTASPTKTLDVNGELNVNSAGTFGGRINTPWLERTYTNTTSSNFTVSVNTTWLDVNTNVLTTLTLPNASTYPGKELHIRQTGTGQIVSFSSNVIPFTSPPTGSAVTAILNPTNNKAVTLVSDGTNWIIMQRSGN